MTADAVSHPVRLLPWRLLKPLLIPVAVAVAAALIATVAVDRLWLLTHVDRFVGDFEIASLLPAAPQDPDIVVVAITEETLQQFQYRSPVDRGFLADLVQTLASRGPRAIGLDILFDQPTEQAKDERMKQVLNDISVPLVVSYSNTPGIVNETQSKYLDAFLPARLRGVANLATDQFDTVRWINPGAAGKDGSLTPSFPRALAAKLGAASPAELTEIDWHGRPSAKVPPFAQYPAQAAAKLPAQWFKDKIILIGAVLSITDRHRTPFATVSEGGEGLLPGIVIQAHSLSQLLHNRRPPEVSWTENLLITLICAGMGAALGLVSLPLVLRIGGGIVVVLLLWGGGGALFHYHDVMIGLVAPTMALAASLWTMEALGGREARRQREFITGAFSRYLSPKLVDRLIRDPSKMSLEGERRVMTFLFTDVADFTKMSEKIESRELARILNSYLDGATEIVLKHDGMLDKFIGDAIFAIFNTPIDLPDHAERAVRCALEIDQYAEAFRKEQNAKGVKFGMTRIGINTGAAVVGNFGSRSRFSYTATGDAVNTAARLEGLNKYLGTRISVAGSTRELCPHLPFRPMAPVVVKGKETAVDIWEPLSEEEAASDFYPRYAAAYAKLAEDSPEAPDLLDILYAERPEDPGVVLHRQRLRNGERGVTMVMTDK